ncbi:MAG: RNA polymerase sigma factor [Lachnospiraceae bacterium]|nr:RNA polymerase sigma factor [Lachnospiraceae bacterium]
MKDDEIISLYWERDEKAIAATAMRYGSYCHAISYNILHNTQDAQECVNDTWLGAWKSMPPNRPNCLPAYLGKITRNLSLNRFRHYSAEKRGHGQAAIVLSELEECVPAQNSVEQVIEGIALGQSINRFLYAQPRQKRNIFIRRYWYLCPIRDIAAAYGMSECKTASLLFRMRNALKTHLEKEGIQL